MRNSIFLSVLLVFLLALFGCQKETSSDTLFVKLSKSRTGITFKNLLRESDEFNVLIYGYFYNGGGIAVGDINNDGLDDIFFTGNMKSSHLYLNQGNMKFKDIAEEAGITAEGLWNTGVTMVDVNNDGYLDIYISRSAAALAPRRANQLYLNNRNLTFTESAQMYGLDDKGYGTHAVFFDYDRDGDLDMYCLNHSVQEYAGFGKNLSQFKNQQNLDFGDKLYRNDQFEEQGVLIGRFTDVTKSSGIKSTVLGFGLGVAVVDANQDNWPDLYVSNDYNEEDYLYINQRDGTFADSLRSMIELTSLFSMGSDVADVNGDGLMDILSLDMLPESHERIMMTSGADNYNKKQALYQSGFHFQSMRNMLQLNNGNGTFSEVGQIAGISNTDWSWAAQFGDVDLDGDQDLYISNGYKADYTNMDFMSYAVDQQIASQQSGDTPDLDDLIKNIPAIEVSNYIYENDGAGHFQNRTKEWGVESSSMANGAVLADLDNDGDLDIITNNINEEAFIYENQTVSSNYLQISLRGCPKNEFCIGSEVTISENGIRQVQQLILSRGFQSSVSPKLTYGVKNSGSKVDIEIVWPNGKYQVAQGVEINDHVTIKYDSSSIDRTFLDVDLANYDVGVTEVGSYNDFTEYPLLHKMYTVDNERLLNEYSQWDDKEASYQRAFYNSKNDKCLVVQADLSNYPQLKSAVLLTKNGTGDIKETTMLDLSTVGLIKDIAWYDINNDGIEDVVVAAEWSEILILHGSVNGFTEPRRIGEVRGLWSSVHVSDVNGDGIRDIIAGNWGLNSQFKASSDEPLGLYSSDWDGNGRSEPIFTKTIDGKVFPYVYKDDLMAQVPSLKRKFNSYKDYSRATVDDIFGIDALEQAVNYSVNELASVIFYGKADGNFEMKLLPAEAQFSPVYAIETTDINDDGRVDILYGGNESLVMEQLGRQMSHAHFVLVQEEDGSFVVDRSFGTIKGEVRDIKVIEKEKRINITGRTGNTLAIEIK